MRLVSAAHQVVGMSIVADYLGFSLPSALLTAGVTAISFAVIKRLHRLTEEPWRRLGAVQVEVSLLVGLILSWPLIGIYKQLLIFNGINIALIFFDTFFLAPMILLWCGLLLMLLLWPAWRHDKYRSYRYVLLIMSIIVEYSWLFYVVQAL
jgi:hypothetical protein